MYFGKFKDLNQAFRCGKYKGMTLGQVWAEHPYYIGWLLSNIPDFTISDEAFQEQIALFPKKKFSLLKQQKRMKERDELEAQLQKQARDYDYSYDEALENKYRDEDTYYALGGSDYDSWKNSDGDLDRMMDGMGF